MICPSLPQTNYHAFAREMSDTIRAEKCEHVWAEIINVRGDSMNAHHRRAARWRIRLVRGCSGPNAQSRCLGDIRARDVPGALEDLSARKAPIPSIRECENTLMVESARKSRCNSALIRTIQRRKK